MKNSAKLPQINTDRNRLPLIFIRGNLCFGVRVIEICINGVKEKLEEGVSLTQVLENKKVKPEMVAVEVNGKLIEKEDYLRVNLKGGDKVEYLFYMAGGHQPKFKV